VPSVLNTLSSCSNSVFPLNNGSLARSSAIIQPTDHISIAVEYSFVPSNSSGARGYSAKDLMSSDPYEVPNCHVDTLHPLIVEASNI